MKITEVSAKVVSGIGYQCQITTAEGKSITFRLFRGKGVRSVVKTGYFDREDFLYLHRRACQEIYSLERRNPNN